MIHHEPFFDRKLVCVQKIGRNPSWYGLWLPIQPLNFSITSNIKIYGPDTSILCMNELQWHLNVKYKDFLQYLVVSKSKLLVFSFRLGIPQTVLYSKIVRFEWNLNQSNLICCYLIKVSTLWFCKDYSPEHPYLEALISWKRTSAWWKGILLCHLCICKDYNF